MVRLWRIYVNGVYPDDSILNKYRWQRLVKILMRLPDGNISTAHLSVLYRQLIRQHESLLARRLEITVHCLCLDGYAPDENAPGIRLASCPSRIFMQPSEDRHGEGRGRPGIQQRCRDPLLVRNDHPAHRYSGTGVFATDGSNPDTTT